MKYELVPKSLDLKRKKRGSFISSVSTLEEEMFAESDFPEAVVPSSIIHMIVFCQTFEMQINMNVRKESSNPLVESIWRGLCFLGGGMGQAARATKE